MQIPNIAVVNAINSGSFQGGTGRSALRRLLASISFEYDAKYSPDDVERHRGYLKRKSRARCQPAADTDTRNITRAFKVASQSPSREASLVAATGDTPLQASAHRHA